MWGLWKPAQSVGGGGGPSRSNGATRLLGFVARLAWAALFVWLVLRKLGMLLNAVLLKCGLAVCWCCVDVGPATERLSLLNVKLCLYTSTCILHTNENTSKHDGSLCWSPSPHFQTRHPQKQR